MRRFKNILLVTNGEGRGAALSRAVALAKTNGAALTVLGFVKEVPREVKLLLAALHPTDLQQELFHEASRRIERSVVRFQNQGIAITVKILPEKSPVETIREVLRNGHDLVMTTANGEERSWFGAAAIRLLRKCPVPVWVLSPGLRRRYRRVLAAVDPSQLESESVGLNTKIMELATSLAHMEKSELHIVHA